MDIARGRIFESNIFGLEKLSTRYLSQIFLVLKNFLPDIWVKYFWSWKTFYRICGSVVVPYCPILYAHRQWWQLSCHLSPCLHEFGTGKLLFNIFGSLKHFVPSDIISHLGNYKFHGLFVWRDESVVLVGLGLHGWRRQVWRHPSKRNDRKSITEPFIANLRIHLKKLLSSFAEPMSKPSNEVFVKNVATWFAVTMISATGEKSPLQVDTIWRRNRQFNRNMTKKKYLVFVISAF